MSDPCVLCGHRTDHYETCRLRHSATATSTPSTAASTALADKYERTIQGYRNTQGEMWGATERLMAERDRYREALRRVVEDVYKPGFLDIARAALDGGAGAGIVVALPGDTFAT